MKSELLTKDNETPAAVYTTEENDYYGAILSRLLKAKINRDTPHVEFNNRTYIQEFVENEKIANTFIDRNKTNENLAIHSGTVEQKLQVILAEVNRLNLMGEVRAYDKDNNELQELGQALTQINDKTAEMELDEEKKLIRQLELLKQGTVFVQDNWVKRYKNVKDISGLSNGRFSDITWKTKLEKVFDGPERQVLYGPGVYLGNIKEMDIKKQPFLFTMNLTSYEEAKSRYGAKTKDGELVWKRWENVPRRRVSLIEEGNLTGFNIGQGWTLSDIDSDMVEELHYQDEINDEFQIFLNGIAMLPVGFPLSAITPNGIFNIEKQILQVINPFFAYGRSFIAKTDQLSKLLDEMIKLLLIKTRKSIHPPYANISGKVISEKSLMPGAISMGIDPGSLVAIGQEGQGVTASEYQMLRELRDDIDRVTVSPQIQGQQGKSGTTAYEVSLLQQQAQKSISLIIFAAALLEKKVTLLRTYYNIAYYFEPIGTKVDETRNKLINVYRSLSKKTNIQGRGNGTRKIKIVDSETVVTPEAIDEEEDYYELPIKTENKKTRTQLGMEPIQIMYVNRDILKNCKYLFFVEVELKPKDTSTNAKMMFRDELRDIQALAAMGASVNIEEVQNEYAKIWNRRKERLFNKPQQGNVMAEEASKMLSSGNALPENNVPMGPSALSDAGL